MYVPGTQCKTPLPAAKTPWKVNPWKMQAKKCIDFTVVQAGYRTMHCSTGAPPACADQADSGLMNRDTNQKYVCAELRGNCTHKDFGATLQINCPMMCGICPPVLADLVRFDWQSMAYGGGLWVAVAADAYTASSSRVMSSANGKAWKLGRSPVAGPPVCNDWSSVAYGDGLWVAVASFGWDAWHQGPANFGWGPDNRVMSSADGKAWTLGTSPLSPTYANDIKICLTSLVTSSLGSRLRIQSATATHNPPPYATDCQKLTMLLHVALVDQKLAPKTGHFGCKP